MGGVDVARRIRVLPADDLLCLIMRCRRTIRELIVLTLPPRYRCSLNRSGPSALAPAQRAGAQRLRALAHRVISLLRGN